MYCIDVSSGNPRNDEGEITNKRRLVIARPSNKTQYHIKFTRPKQSHHTKRSIYRLVFFIYVLSCTTIIKLSLRRTLVFLVILFSTDRLFLLKLFQYDHRAI